jgi:hypothetical protein
MLYALMQRRYFARSHEWRNEFGQQTDSYQAHDGSVTVGTTPEVRYNDYLCTSVKGRLEIIFRIVKFRAADLCFCVFDRWFWIFSAYGSPVFMNGTGTVQSSSAIGFETLYAGYRFDGATPQMYYVRNRFLLAMIGTWNRRDPLGYVDGMGLTIPEVCLKGTDPFGLYTVCCTFEQNGTIFSENVRGDLRPAKLCRQRAIELTNAAFGDNPARVVAAGSNTCNVAAAKKYWLCAVPVQQSGRPSEDCVANCTGAEHVSIGIGTSFPLQEGRHGKGGAFACNKKGVKTCRLGIKNYGRLDGNPKPCWQATDDDIKKCLAEFAEKSEVFRHVTDNCQVDVANAASGCCLDSSECEQFLPAKYVESRYTGFPLPWKTIFGY